LRKHTDFKINLLGNNYLARYLFRRSIKLCHRFFSTDNCDSSLKLLWSKSDR